MFSTLFRHHFRRTILSSDAYAGQCLHRTLCTTKLLFKRRKTAEERKSPKIIEYSPKKSNRIKLHGTVDIWRNITVRELANACDRSLDDIQEIMLYVKGADDLEPTAQLENVKVIREIVLKCGLKSRIVGAPEKEETQDIKDRDVTPRPPAPIENLKARPPVVTVMGHVDHGKTTLLDSLRGADVAAGEAGGITQHIGAFTVSLPNKELVTFLDTPGHAAFSAMRARGANLTDIVVLVVAAEDGVMAQTREVIKLAQETNVPIIVALNKIDKPEADIEKAKRELMQMGLALEEFGGDVQVIPISALKGTNLDLLAEAVSTQATLMGLQSEYVGPVEGVVVESKTHSKRGKLSTAIITRGTLRKGAILVSGLAHARVRALFDHNGQPIEEVTPGIPVEILGWRELPVAGEIILEVGSERKANSVLRFRNAEHQKLKADEDMEHIKAKEEEHIEKYLAAREARRLAGKFKMRRQGPRQKEIPKDDGMPRVNVIIKGDVHGSVEAILDVLETYDRNDKCKLDVVHYGVGDVTEGDIELAKSFNAIIYAFSVDAPVKAKNVSIRPCNVIYRLIDNLKEEISNKLQPLEVEDVLGEANVLQKFMINDGKKQVAVAGSRCVSGVLKKKEKFKLVRDGEVIYTGELESMRHLKNEVESIKNGVECGLRFKNNDVQPEHGDVIVCFTTHMEAQKTDWDPGF